MKILFSHYGLYRKNGWGRTFELASGLKKLGNDVTILTTGSCFNGLRKTINEEGVTIVLFKDFIPQKLLSSGYGILSLLNRLIYSITHKFDICHSDSHRDNGFIPCLVNRFFYKSKIIVEWWDNFEEKAHKNPPHKWHKKYLVKQDLKKEISTKFKADGVIPLSQLLYKRALNIGIKQEKMIVLNGGCNIENIKELPWSKEVLGIPENYTTFGLIGMGDAEFDDMRHFYEALILSSKNHLVKFINYGRSLDKTLEILPELKSLLVEGGWIDYYKDISRLEATDVFVLAKEDNIINRSGWPTKFGDYLACGRPIIANIYGEIKPFVDTYHPAILEINHVVEDVSNIIDNICCGKYDLITMGKRNRQVAELNSWEKRANTLESFYLKFLS